MSDPVTNVEIEDVLSSIRRLVSEDARVRPLTDIASDRASERSSALADEIAPTREAPGKLVLTPALRVADSGAAAQDHEDSADESIDRDSAREAEAEQQNDAEAAPFSVSDMPDSAVHESAVHEAEPTVHHDEAQPEVFDDVPADATQSADAMPWEDHHEGHHDTHSDALLLDDALSVEDAGAADTLLQEPRLDADETSQAAASPRSDAAGSSDGFVFSSVRDGGEQGTIAQEDMAQSDQQDTAEAFSDTESAESLFADDETILDEEMLRELVTEIVRQELQGALGERITRNVRKLVRREIHRALTSHELE